MLYDSIIPQESPLDRRVRAILLTEDRHILFIKRIKPHKPQPYWVAPGGGVEDFDLNLESALTRELNEELGAIVDILRTGFILRHSKAGKNLEEHFFLCRLHQINLHERSGPEFADPSRGSYLPDYVPLERNAIQQLNIRTIELKTWLLEHLERLRSVC